MAKPPKGNDATQELTMDQLVTTMPPKLPPGGKNDVSLWGRLVVGAEEFTPGATAATKPARWPIILLLLGALGAAGVAVFFIVTSDESTDTAAAPAVDPPKPEPPKPEPPKPEPPKPEANALEAKALEAAKPADAKPVEPTPAESKPLETKLAAPPAETQAADAKTVEPTKPAVAAVKKPVRRPVTKRTVTKKPVAKKRR